MIDEAMGRSAAGALPTLGPGTWISEARALGDRICNAARLTADGVRVWLAPTGDMTGKTSLLPLHLYNGSVGTALFLAALHRATGDDRYRETALAALRLPLRRLERWCEAPSTEEARVWIGGLVGLGGYVYAFSRLSRWLGQPELLESACAAAAQITPQRIEADDALDILHGSAGAVLALLLLDREIPAEHRDPVAPLDRAVACGAHLLRRRVSQDGKPRAWPVQGRRPACGFAHGASGISYALARLAERTGRSDFLEGALEGLDFERLHCVSEHRDWRHLGRAWCSGAPGIGLARLGLPAGLDDPTIGAEIRATLSITCDEPLSGLDTLCCGNQGRVEVLLQAARLPGDDALLSGAADLASRMLERAGSDRVYRCALSGEETFTPSLFTGAAGIGYTFLRLAGVSDLPCLLCLE